MFRNKYVNYIKGVSCNIMNNNRKLQVKVSSKMEIIHELWIICPVDVMNLFKKSMR